MFVMFLKNIKDIIVNFSIFTTLVDKICNLNYIF
ncbi:hypothetical protein MMG03_000146 [Fibrobacter succinogenes]|nr:hypothetical protein [Fibrobacter succinogenes]